MKDDLERPPTTPSEIGKGGERSFARPPPSPRPTYAGPNMGYMNTSIHGVAGLLSSWSSRPPRKTAPGESAPSDAGTGEFIPVEEAQRRPGAHRADEGASGLPQLGRYFEAITRDPRVVAVLEELDDEVRTEHAALQKTDVDAVAELVAIRAELVRINPGVDDSVSMRGRNNAGFDYATKRSSPLRHRLSLGSRARGGGLQRRKT